MREIKFRGRSKKNGEWVFGCLSRYSQEMSYITIDLIENRTAQVFADTVGQFTGLKDKNGKEIYEGDILKLRALQYEVKYETHGFWCRDGNGIFWPQEKEGEVIGNIWENPELLSN